MQVTAPPLKFLSKLPLPLIPDGLSEPQGSIFLFQILQLRLSQAGAVFYAQTRAKVP